MDDGDIQLSDNAMLLNTESSSDFQALTSMNMMNGSFTKTMTCTHTHTCNPPGPNAVHTHTCYHTHTQVFAPEPDDKEHTKSKARRPSTNREAVRKYREKKKAHTAYLEEEVKRLHLQHVQLVRKLQKQAILEAELSRLRSILIDLRRKIDNELGVFPYKQCASYGQTNFPCFNSPHVGSSSQVAICGNGKFASRREGNCQPAIDCQVNVDNKASTEEEEESIEGDG
ncbi:basic leucine zipper 19-like [Neltuma alba]|uniref:basic leucine zipper 19-like n=1 Tax=Neltuma alba TaxID=207710 RepID=UPI0010A41FB8|nr:basic leucine zipper 19-like [Prosopis alba]XP_028760557.1 basic leucine zipper 19-like [Prosopis alba]